MTKPVSGMPGIADPAPDYAVLRWLVAATFIVILNETIMMNALPPLMAAFEISARTAQWLSTAFMLTMAVVIPVTGWFLLRVTTRQAFATAMVVFCAGTLLAALAPTFWVLVLGRVIQASGTAVMMPLLMTTLMSVVPEYDRGRVMGNVTLAMSVAPALGPAVSGVVLQWLSWRWMFGLVLPVAALIAVSGLSRLRNVSEPSAGSLDLPSVGLAAFGFGSLVYGLSLIGAPDALVAPGYLIAGGVVLVAVFAWRQVRLQRGKGPLLDLRTLNHRTYALALGLMSVAFMSMLGAMILLPIYLQDVRGLSTLQTGMVLMPGGLAMGLLGPRVGHWFDLHGGRPLVIPGAFALVAALLALTQVGAATPVAFVLGSYMLLMIGLAAVFTPVFTLGLGAVPQELYSHASSLLGTLQQVAGALGAAAVVTVMSSRADALIDTGLGDTAALVGGMRWAFALGAALSLIALVLAFVMPGRPAEQLHVPSAAGIGEDLREEPVVDPV